MEYNRAVIKVERNRKGAIDNELVIFSNKDCYTTEFIKLIKDFYLNY